MSGSTVIFEAFVKAGPVEARRGRDISAEAKDEYPDIVGNLVALERFRKSWESKGREEEVGVSSTASCSSPRSRPESKEKTLTIRSNDRAEW